MREFPYLLVILTRPIVFESTEQDVHNLGLSSQHPLVALLAKGTTCQRPRPTTPSGREMAEAIAMQAENGHPAVLALQGLQRSSLGRFRSQIQGLADSAQEAIHKTRTPRSVRLTLSLEQGVSLSQCLG